MAGAREQLLRQAKLVVLLLFCLVNPFAGWAYLATAREKWDRDEAPISGTLNRKRLAVRPLEGADALVGEWREAMLAGLDGYDPLELVDHDPSPLGRNMEADLVLDASSALVDDELRLFVRLVRVTDSAVLWSQAYAGAPGDFASFCDDVILSVIQTLAMQ